MSEHRVAAVVPALNEAETIGRVVRQLSAQVSDVVVVDDGSSDRTAAEAETEGATVVVHERNCGYGRSIEDGFACAIDRGAEIVLTFDADGQHDAADIPKVVAPIQAGRADVVVGRRPETARLTEYLFGWYTSQRLGVTDPLCGFKAYRSEIYGAVGYFEQFSTIGTQLLFEAAKRGYTITEVPISLNEREDESRFGQQFEANLKIALALSRIGWFDLTTRRDPS
jgi:glycosyltransferase involved in cell wall biosynthesis